MLRSEEIENLRNGSFWLDCPYMILQKQSRNSSIIYTGPGYIRQSPEGGLKFAVYAKEDLSLEQLVGPRGRIGELIPDDEFYSLTANDKLGKKWVSRRILPSFSQNTSQRGTICEGIADEIENEIAGANKGDYLYMEIFDDIRIPVNATTSVATTRAGKRSESIYQDTLSFASNEYKFQIRKDRKSLVVEVESNAKPIPKHFELRILETLRFLLARPLLWTVLYKNVAGTQSTIIRPSKGNQFEPRVQPPIKTFSRDTVDWFCQLFEKYLNYISSNTEFVLHPISIQLQALFRASTGSIQTEVLVLCVAIESILASEFPQYGKAEENILKAVENALDFLKKWSWNNDPEGQIKGRIFGSLHTIIKPNASNRLSELIDIGVIVKSHKDAWNDLRNKAAHGSGLNDVPTQQLINLSNVVLELLYKLIFFKIGYQGKYTAYSVSGWPIEEL